MLRTVVHTLRGPLGLRNGACSLAPASRCYSTPDPDRRTTALTVISDLRHLRQSPLPALTLGLAGLAPFVSAPAYMILTQTFDQDIAQAQLAYSASILSFLGGVRWGATLPTGSTLAPNWRNLIYSVSPSLIAWIALMMPYPASTLTSMTGLCGAGYMDLTLEGYPRWFKALRFLLTFVAVLSLWTTVTVKYMVKPAKPKDRAEHNSELVKSDSKAD